MRCTDRAAPLSADGHVLEAATTAPSSTLTSDICVGAAPAVIDHHCGVVFVP
jgi:hypothetical protein